MHLPPIRQMQYLVALQDEGHFSRAAERVHVGQSTLSTGIKELETFLGTTLVERTNKTVMFTDAGNQIADRCRYIIMQTEDLIADARTWSDPLSTPIKLGVIPTIAPYLISPFISAIRRQFSGLKLFIREDTTANLINELADNKLDLALLALPFETSKVETRVIYREPLHLAFNKKSDIRNAKRFSFDTLPDERLLLLDDGHCLRDHALNGCRLRHHRKIHTFGANSLQMLLEMVNDDLGVTLIPDMAVRAGVLKRTNVAIRSLPADRYYRDVGFAWRRGSSRVELVEGLMALLPLPQAK